ncbi:ATP-binding protein [Fluviicola taffensis]|uniref:histidine kinase n=1 Tax=Fluviicola taffensis (strain DSM 16823 / NCIMB 13979 / RW262) TaxID=755732 RepID=F2IH67_FLUTR|nr:ATP-binding protein [Fluviicola taffensis]AEA45881.1 multi-sensor signal transduction histidine kinase [Fluviicola taffensis DSM 16823]
MTEARKKFYPFLLFLLFFVPQAFADSLDYSKISVTKLIDISRKLESTNIHESIRILKVAILLPEATSNKGLKHRILIDLSSAQMQSGDYKSAINTAYQALSFAQATENNSRIGEAQFIIGWIFKELDVLLKARNHFEAAMKSYQKAKDLTGFLESKNYVGHCLTDYGSEKSSTWYLDEAKKVYKSILLEAKTKKRSRTILQCNNNLSNLYLIYYKILKRETDLEISRNYALKCIYGSLNLNDTLSHAVGYSNFGEAYGLEGKVDSLKKYLDYSRVIYVRQALPDYIFSNCRLLLKSYLFSKRVNDAEELLKEYETYIKRFQFLSEYKYFYEYYSELESLKGNYKAAYEYRLRYNLKFEENSNDENAKELIRLQFLYDLNKKNEEIAILNRNKLLQSDNNENQVVIRNLLIGSIALLIALLIFIYVRYKDRVSSNQLILSKNKELERLSIVASNTNNGITITNAHGIISWINEGFVRLYGWNSSEEFLESKGTSIYNASGLTRAELSSFIEKAVDEKESIIFQSFKELKNQEQKYIQTSLTPVFDEQDELKFLVYVDTDITDLLEARELAIREKRKAENALKTQELFLANVSHEIRTPMNGIIGLTRQLNDEKLSHSQQEILDTLDSSANGLLHVVNDLLDVSKIRAGKMTFEYVRFSLRDLLNTFATSISYRSEEKKLRFNLEFTEKLPNYIIGDPIRLNQILLNIVGNAIKFTIEGSITLKVYSIEQKNGMERIHFEIKDTGIGIPTHKQDFVFENFMQIEDHRTRTTSGTGLGLGIAKSLVEALGGEIHLFSQEGNGTTVVFELDFELHKQHVETKNMKQEDIVLMKDLHGLRILLVEDNKINQRVILYDLGKWNVDVHTVDNAIDAISILKDRSFDLILMDYYMPRMDGMEATTFIRTKFAEPTCSIPIIAITAAAMVGDQNKFLEAGMNDYISKPFNPEKLYQLLVKWSSQDHGISTTIENEKREDEIEFIDLSILEERAEGSEEYLLDMYGAYLEMMPQYSLDLIQFYEERDLVELRKQAHQILSPARLFGMHITADLLLKLEKDETLNEEEMKELVSEIVNQIQLCEKTIRDEVTKIELGRLN